MPYETDQDIVALYCKLDNRCILLFSAYLPLTHNAPHFQWLTHTPAATSDMSVAGALNALFANVYVYLHGHEVGGTNPSLLNAMHMNAAPVAMDVVFHREVMSDEGIFFNRTRRHLASIMEQLDQDESAVLRLRQLAKTRSDTLYRWDAVVDAYVSMVNRVAENFRSRDVLANDLQSDIYRPQHFALKENHNAAQEAGQEFGQ